MKDNSTGKNKDFYEKGKNEFDAIEPVEIKRNRLRLKRLRSDKSDWQIIELLGSVAADNRYRRLSRFEQMVEIIEGHLESKGEK